MAVTIYEDMLEAAELYEDGAELIFALLKYAERGEEPSRSELWYPTFVALRDRASMSREAHENGRKGGRPKRVSNPSANGLETEGYEPDSAKSGKLMSREEKSREEKREKRFVAPSVEDVRDYCSSQSLDVDAERFVDYYSSKGWKVGKSPMKDWRAAARNWARRDSSKPKLVIYDAGVVEHG